MSVAQACSKADLEPLVRLANRVFRGSGDGDMQAEYPLVFGEENLGFCRIVKEGDEVVSHVGISIRDARILGCAIREASIGAVCTDAGVRGKGYASLLMDDSRRIAVEQGASLMLISGGRGLYHRLGYVTVGSFSYFRLAAAQVAPVAGEVTVAPCRTADIPELCALNESRPVRYVRSVDDWEKMLGAGFLMNHAADCVGIRQDGRLVAYAGTHRPGTDASGKTGPARVYEHGGAETALFDALPAIAATYGTDRLELVAMPGTRDIARLLRHAGAEEQEIAFGGTLGIIDPARFLEGIRPHLEERLGAHADALAIEPVASGGARFTLGSEAYELDTMGRLTALVFGGSTDEARDVPPAPPALGALLARVFPLPLLWYGYNYV